MSRKVLFENEVFKEILVAGKWLRYEMNPNASLTQREDGLLREMLSREVFTAVEGVSFWYNGDYVCDYMFTEREKEFSFLKSRQQLPRWIRDCRTVRDFFVMIAWIKSNKGHLVQQGRWGLFLLNVEKRLGKQEN